MTLDSPEPHALDVPRVSVQEIQRLAAAELSLPSRVGQVLLLMASLLMAAAVGSLWATEPSLPLRTHAAFGVTVTSAVSWAAFAVWVLARRRVLFGADRVLASAIGVTFSAIGALGMTALGYWTDVGRGAYVGALMHTVFCAVATTLLVRARHRVTLLSRRRLELADQLARSASR
ncbi:MAG: hypothetical protein M3541_08190 [Acidobacteriota bacterium]|nr:hypothetical protein [Acidobacteriota bacterium]